MFGQIEMLKQGIPDPSCIGTSGSQAQSTSALTSSGDKENDASLQDEQPEHFADAVFVHTKFVPATSILTRHVGGTHIKIIKELI